MSSFCNWDEERLSFYISELGLDAALLSTVPSIRRAQVYLQLVYFWGGIGGCGEEIN
ncbi:MAG: hypothetical protein QG665_493 [Patescibacteria group bacterium]|nr:hypothetical protein [Patescibacteria group bacterium]